MTKTLRATAYLAAALTVIAAFIALAAGARLVAADTARAVEAAETAYQEAANVARAVDRGEQTLTEPQSCEQALERPSSATCREYEAALKDYLEDAWEPCEEGYARAEDLSCVPPGFYEKEDKS